MEEATVAKIATEALKPVSSIVDALLSAKLERLKNWAEKRDLRDRLGSTVIDNHLEEFLRRQLRRVSSVTTIVFPQQPFSLPKIYEPLLLKEQFSGKFFRNGRVRSDPYSQKNPDDSFFDINLLEAGRNFLIVDSAGMGKSTFSKHLVLEIMNSTSKIPIFLELRRIDEGESLLGRICADIDETKIDIDEKLLLLLFEEGNFVFLLDGYDEVSGEMREKVGRQIEELAVRCHSNSMILTARPEVNLPEIPDSKAFAMRPLSKSQARSLVLRYDAVANLNIGRQLIKEFNLVPAAFLETPLLVALLYRTYGFNQSIATKISSLYDEIYNALYKGHDLTKSGFARAKTCQLDSEDFRRLLRGFSFLLLVHQKDSVKSRTDGITIIDEAIKLTSVKPLSASSFLDDLLLAVPLIIRDGTEFRFVHKSLGEFFAAEFLAYQPESEQIIQPLINGHLAQTFINTFEYLSDINPSLFRRMLVAPLAKRILEEKDPVQDPCIRSIDFLGQVNLGLWPYDKYVVKTKDIGDELTIPRVEESISASFYYGNLKGIRYILAIAEIKQKIRLPFAVWKAISVDSSKRVDRPYSSSDYDFNGLEQGLTMEEWMPITDERVLNSSNHPVLKDILVTYLGFHGRLQISKPASEVRFVSEDTCQNLLYQIQKEDETQQWLKQIISKAN